jgi:deoxyribonuclease IV
VSGSEGAHTSQAGQVAHHAHSDTPRGPLLGAHMSIAGGVQQALYRAQQAGCEAVQIFTKTSRQWQGKPLTEEDMAVFREAQQATGMTTVVAHASYLLNLAAADRTLWEKSLHACIDEMERCEALAIPLLVAHPGAHVGAGAEAGLTNIARAIDAVHTACAGFRTRITLEITAGQGTCLGYRFAHMRAILERVRDSERLRFCFDTQHAFAAGYDLRTAEGYARTFAEFDALIGLQRLGVFHLNDAKQGLGSRVDRHAHIGAGCLGAEPFRRVMQDRRFWGLPMCLETPKSQDLHEDIAAQTLLRGFLTRIEESSPRLDADFRLS